MGIVEEQIIYKKTPQAELTLHIFRPEEPASKGGRAGIVFFHGGGWVGGEPAQFFQQSRYLARLGMVAASAQYRLIDVHGTTPFECVIDGKSAVRWLRHNADRYDIDPGRIAAGGGSAGGHVAACTGTLSELDEKDEDPAISSHPDALVLFNPVLDTTKTGWDNGAKRLGKRGRELSALHYISNITPPTIIFHGTDDQAVPFENARRFTAAMADLGLTCELIPFEGAGHGFFNAGRDDNTSPFIDTMQATETFLRKLGFLK